MNSRRGGAASAAPPPTPNQKRERERKSTRKRGGQETVSSSTRSVLYDPEVLNWVRRHTRTGTSRDDLVRLSETAEDWPAPGRSLSDGSLAAARCAIYHLEQQGARWPLKPDSTLGNWDAARAGKRLYQIGQKRAAARRDNDPAVIWDTAFQVSKLAWLLMSLNLDDLDLDEEGLDILSDLDNDLLYLQDWTSTILAAVEARLGEQELRKKIAGLEAKTVANGCTPEEEAAARRIASRMRRRLEAVLPRAV
jgi:hypothetical protein